MTSGRANQAEEEHIVQVNAQQLPECKQSNSHESLQPEAEQDELSYASLNNFFDNAKLKKTPAVKYVGECGITSIRRDSFIAFAYVGEKELPGTEEGRLFQDIGLKFHISLPECRDAELDFNRGWVVVRDILNANQASFKIIRAHVSMSDDPVQHGKVITVYATTDKDSAQWQRIFQEITQQLANVKVPPGYRPPGSEEKPERVMSGTNYVTYRFEDEDKRIEKLKPQDKNRVLSLLDNKRQLLPQFDTIGKILINVENQLTIPDWKPKSQNAKNQHGLNP